MALQATFHIHVILLPIGIQKICLVPFRKHHLGWSSSWVVYCISFYRLECIIQYTLTWLKYVTEYQIVHYATLTLRRCAVFVVCFFFASSSHYHVVHMEYTNVLYKARLFIYKHPDLLQNLQRRTLQIRVQKTKKKLDLQEWKMPAPLCDKGCTSTTHTIKSEDYQIGHQGISYCTSLSDVSFPFWSK